MVQRNGIRMPTAGMVVGITIAVLVSGMLHATESRREPVARVADAVVRPASATATVGEPDIDAYWTGATEWMQGINWGGETYYGSIGRGVDFLGSGITAGEYIPVDIEFTSDTADWSTCQTFRRPGYSSAGVGTFPGAAWDVSDTNNPRRVNLCFVEWDDGAGSNPAPDSIWNPNDNIALAGKREYLLVMNSDYDSTGLTYDGTNLASGNLDNLYGWWPLVTSGSSILETEPATLSIKPYYVRNLYGVPDSGQITLGWSFDGTPASFDIYWGLSSPATILLMSVSGSQSQFVHSDLTNGTDYYYRVDAFDGSTTKIGESLEIVAKPQIVSHRTSLVGWWNGRNTYGDCWGYVDTSNGKEYALICARNEGVSVIDLDSDPPAEVGFLPAITPGNDMKDIKIYKHYAVALSESEPIQIFDIADPTSPSFVSSIQPLGGDGAHNCMVDGDYLYVVGNHDVGGLEIFDISNPASPSPVGTFQPFYYHDIDIRNDTMYACGIYGDGVDVLDISNKSAPSRIIIFNYPGSGAHNVEISEDGHYAFIGDEIGTSGNHTRVFDIADPTSVEYKTDIIVDPDAVTHNCYVKNKLLYIAHYTEGLRIWNVADPLNPTEWAYYDSYLPGIYGYYGEWNVYPYLPSGRIIVSDMQTGLYIIELDEAPITCECDCFGDPQCDGIPDVFDVIDAVDIAFRGGAPIFDPNPLCQDYQMVDVTCDQIVDVFDIVAFVDAAFRGVPPSLAFCHPCQ